MILRCIAFAIVLMAAHTLSSAERVNFDLTQWTPPSTSELDDDPFGNSIRAGRELFTNTANELGPTVPDPARRFAGNHLTCQNCHLQAGTKPYAMPLTGVWGQFPQYRAREGHAGTLEDRINGCMERSMNGRALPLESWQMKALLSYLHWLSTGIPGGAKLAGAGILPIQEPARAADLDHGAGIYSRTCATCHGSNGLGERAQSGAGYQFPPLWGPDSFNNGAGMSRLLTAAGYAKHNMPIGTAHAAPVLTDEEAYDVAGYIVAQKRPEMRNLDKDYPLRLQKPIDAPYGPYADDFSLEQHKFGPFGPIRASVKALAAASLMPHGGAAGRGSDEQD
jgi:thiosulfate dehydrogenase